MTVLRRSPQIAAGRVARKKYVRLQEHRQHQRAAGRAGDVTVALGAPYIIPGAHLAFVIDETALEHESLLDLDMLVQRELGARLPAEERGQEPGFRVFDPHQAGGR